MLSGSFGVYAGNEPADVLAFNRWVGRNADFVLGHTGRAGWADWQGSIGWLADRFNDLPGKVVYSIPMFAEGGSLHAGATGEYDARYKQAARDLLANDHDAGPIYIRVGEEFNGFWEPWHAAGREADFIGAYRHFVDAFRSVSPRFNFEWNVNIGREMDPSKAYPGDAYVDVVGMDFYYDTAYMPRDPIAAWNQQVTQKWGLQWLENFAKAHGKPTAYSEWGVNSPDAAAYMQQAAKWFESHNVVYQIYWDSNAAFHGKVSGGALGATSAAYAGYFAHHGPTSDVALGNDTYTVTKATDIVDETNGNGADTVLSSINFSLADTAHVKGDVENLTLTQASWINAIGNALNNVLTGNSGNNSLYGLSGNDTLHGLGGADRLDGAAGNDVPIGGAGNDVVIGGLGNDRLVGSLGRDVMTGGAGRDIFDFNAVAETGKTLAARDAITDFQLLTDKIDLVNIDARTGAAGNQAFSFIGTQGFHHKEGELHYKIVSNHTIVEGDVNGDAQADFQIDLSGLKHLMAGDFIL